MRWVMEDAKKQANNWQETYNIVGGEKSLRSDPPNHIKCK
jgi:hypothetical protein